MLEQAIALHRQGRLPEAEQAYRAILAREPENAAVGNLLGQLALDAGMPQAAIPILEHVVTLAPYSPAFHTDLGIGYFKAGRADEAQRSFERALTLDENFVQAHFQRGIALMEPDPPEALASFDRALAIDPKFGAAHNLRGMVLLHLGRAPEALPSFETALRLDPENPMAQSNLGNALVRLERYAEAITYFESALALAPDNAAFHYNMGQPLRFTGRREEARAVYDRAIALQPDLADAYVNRGLVNSELVRVDEALADFDRAIALDPLLKSAHLGRSGALVVGDRVDEALAYNRKMSANPAFRPDMEFHSAFLLLQRGEWEEGWKFYEARRHKDDPVETRTYPQSEWLGEGALDGKTLYVYGEQGLGDVIMFSRYLALAQAKGARVIFSPQDRLARLMRSLPGQVEILPFKTPPENFDLHMPLISMPLAFGTRPDTVPANVPYLHAEPALVEKWKQRIGAEGFKIGICWQGSNNTGMGVDRSFPLRELEAIAALPGVRLISLQKMDGLEQLNDLPPGMKVETLGDDFDAGDNAFVDTAAAIQAVDLVISCDTSVAHLAGAMGHPCWTALKHQPEWRWMQQEETTPWYPGMRLFRQPSDGGWPRVFGAMTAALKAKLA